MGKGLEKVGLGLENRSPRKGIVSSNLTPSASPQRVTSSQDMSCSGFVPPTVTLPNLPEELPFAVGLLIKHCDQYSSLNPLIVLDVEYDFDTLRDDQNGAHSEESEGEP